MRSTALDGLGWGIGCEQRSVEALVASWLTASTMRGVSPRDYASVPAFGVAAGCF
jgi:hypothetical protein